MQKGKKGRKREGSAPYGETGSKERQSVLQDYFRDREMTL